MRCSAAEIIGTAVLEIYTLYFRGSKTGSYLTIEPKLEMSINSYMFSRIFLSSEIVTQNIKGVVYAPHIYMSVNNISIE